MKTNQGTTIGSWITVLLCGLFSATGSLAGTHSALSDVFTLDTRNFTNAPAAPTGLTASKGAYTDKVRLTWIGVANASGYGIYRSTSSSTSDATALASSTATNYDDTSATPGQLLYYWVKATNADGASAFSSSDTGWSGTITNAPAAPTGLTASKGIYTDKVRLSWVGVANVSGYVIYRSTSSSSSEATALGGSTTTNYDDTSATPGQLLYYWVKATNVCGASAFCSSDTGWRGNISAGVCADYDGDGKADPAIYDETTGTWKIKLSSANYYLLITTINGLGGPGYASVAADYDGDRKADPAVYHELTGRWIILPSSANYAVAIIISQPLGGIGYSGMPADYDGDNFADPGVYQRERGDWKVMLSSANYYSVEVPGLLGGTGYRAVAADYDGDHKADPAIYGEMNGLWMFKISSANYLTIILTHPLGGTGYIPVPADYDGDGRTDPAVKSETGNEWIVMFSSGGYTPVSLTILFE